ncbi:terpene synthase family protein [Kitasatospora sp. NBC_01539]|uniref:terpene synthase family protein n=1 Tax=Kitasatospora sp. NBC_01539 TaxID=2903577 RepID=UPI0038602F5B
MPYPGPADPADRAERLLAWFLEVCPCHRDREWHTSTARVAAAFGVHCGPAGATPGQSFTADVYLVFFLALDDAPAPEKAAFATALRGGSMPPGSAPAAAHRALMDDLDARCLPTARLCAEISDLAAAMAREGEADPAAMTWDEFHALRRATIGTGPFVTLWRLLRGLPVPDPSAGPEPAVADAVEASYLANDLASLDRDRTAHPDDAPVTSNHVLFHAHRAGHDGLRTAVEAALTRYALLVARVGRAEGELGHLLRDMVEGSVDAHRHLAGTRYPGAAARMDRLRRVGHDREAGA